MVHDAARPGKLFRGDVLPRLEQVPNPFVMYVAGPMRPEQARDCKRHQRVAQRRRVQDAGIVDDGRCLQSIPHF